MKAKYIRVSTTEQNAERQQEKGYKTFIDICSGSVSFSDRKAAKRLLKAVQEGVVNEVRVHSIDRLGRNTLDILNTIQDFTQKGVAIVSKKEGLTTIIDGKENPTAKLIISIMATLAEFELEQIRERQLEGIMKAKERGVYKNHGGSKALTTEQFLAKPKNAACARELKKGESLRRAAKLAAVSLATAQKVSKLLKK